MKITKFGHCCLLIEVAGKKILTDPGKWSSGFEALTDIDLILITHEHADHLHAEAVVAIREKNPAVIIIANDSVGKILASAGVPSERLGDKESKEYGGVRIGAYAGKHAEIFEDFGQVENIGYLIADKLFYPGDAYSVPGKEVELLALPVAGPWCRSVDAIRYALEVKPKRAFPVHDAVLSDAGIELTHGLFDMLLRPHGIEFIKLKDRETYE